MAKAHRHPLLTHTTPGWWLGTICLRESYSCMPDGRLHGPKIRWSYEAEITCKRKIRLSEVTEESLQGVIWIPHRYTGISLTHWGRVMHICINRILIIGSDNGLSPNRRQAIIWTNAGILLIGPLGTNFSEIPIELIHFHSWKYIWKCCLQNGIHFVSASRC